MADEAKPAEGAEQKSKKKKPPIFLLAVAGIMVVDVYGDRPSVLRAFVRTLGYGIAVLPFSLGVLWIGFDREKRGLHDWLAGTYVVLKP